jgi:hypothetical protein
MKAVGWMLSLTGLLGTLVSIRLAVSADAETKFTHLVAIGVFFVIGVVGLGLVFSDKKQY